MKNNLIMRLDDACPFMDIDKWSRMESLLDLYEIKPLVGIIPNCQDSSIVDKYKEDTLFKTKIQRWISKDWMMAMHGCTHVYSTKSGGINPVNKRSEFSGESLEVQEMKISEGIEMLRAKYSIEPKVFFAPSHTFDENTLKALKKCSKIRNISDTIANKPYLRDGFTFVPVQSGTVRSLPLNTVTYCYHPNSMQSEVAWHKLDDFLSKNKNKFISYSEILETKRERSMCDQFISWLYFVRK